MSATIYSNFRNMIEDSASPYQINDLRVYKYLDEAIDKLSEIVRFTYKEDVTISDSDILAGYKDFTMEIINIISSGLGGFGNIWELAGGRRIRFVYPEYVASGVYGFVYRAKYKKFDGSSRDDSYFNHPSSANGAIVDYAVALFLDDIGITKADGKSGVVTSISEEGMSTSFLNSPQATAGNLKSSAIEAMRRLSNSLPILFDVNI